jgi:hypothetical protein
VARRERRSIPDNLDPLVDTLSNVVGILVIVVALTQIQLGDALARVARLDRLRGEHEEVQAEMPTEAKMQALRRDELLRRTEVDLDAATELARQTLAQLGELGAEEADAEDSTIEALELEFESSRRSLEEALARLDQRTRYQRELEIVPRHMVARLPDPQILQGKEAWIMVRFGRVYIADRESLLNRGSRAIGRVLQDGVDRRIREDEFEAVARYLRKRDVGQGAFRWQLETEPAIRVQLAWRSRQGGLDRTDLATSMEFRQWLDARDPEVDFIRFKVWGDSFETYLAARELVEAAGFRAGWRGYESDDEIELSLRFGPPNPETGPVEVD